MTVGIEIRNVIYDVNSTCLSVQLFNLTKLGILGNKNVTGISYVDHWPLSFKI